MVPRIKTANNVPQTLPIPPYKLVPPRIIAAMIVNKCEPAALGAAAPSMAVSKTPANAPLKPDKTYKIINKNIQTDFDHRIAMAFSIMGSKIGPLNIAESDSINTSFPNFKDELNRLGGNILWKIK